MQGNIIQCDDSSWWDDGGIHDAGLLENLGCFPHMGYEVHDKQIWSHRYILVLRICSQAAPMDVDVVTKHITQHESVCRVHLIALQEQKRKSLPRISRARNPPVLWFSQGNWKTLSQRYTNQILNTPKSISVTNSEVRVPRHVLPHLGHASSLKNVRCIKCHKTAFFLLFVTHILRKVSPTWTYFLDMTTNERLRTT